MNRFNHNAPTAPMYQQIAQRRDGHDAMPPEAVSDVVNALAAQLARTQLAAGGELHVRIGRLRIIVANPAALEAAGLRGRLGLGI